MKIKRSILSMALVFTTGVAGSAVAGDAAGKARVLFTSEPDADRALVHRVEQFVSRQLGVRTAWAPLDAAAAGSKQTVLDRVSADRGGTDAVVLAFVRTDGASDLHMEVDPEKSIAAIRLNAVQSEDAEIFARRVERQAMRAVVFLVGLEPSLDPYCVTRPYRTLEDLDSMGRNLSPPWFDRFRRKAADLGLLEE
jgi:hypothetical protein